MRYGTGRWSVVSRCSWRRFSRIVLRPPGRVDGAETTLIGGQLAVLVCHGSAGVVGDAFDWLGFLEGPPIVEQRNEILVIGTAKFFDWGAASCEHEGCC